MDSPRHSPLPTGTTRSGAERRSARRFQTGVGGLLVVIACCGVVAWSARTVWESHHPAAAAARRLQFGTASQRARAARELMAAGVKEPRVAVVALVTALDDPAAEVRTAAAEALGVIGGEDALTGSDGDAARAATAGLIRSLKDPDPPVPIAAMHALVRIATTQRRNGPVDVQAIIDGFASALGNRDAEVRLVALKSLARCGWLGSPDPPEAFVAALGDRSTRVRAAAIAALPSFQRDLDPWLPDLLKSVEDADREVSLACWPAFARDNPPGFSAAAIPALVTALGSRSPSVRSQAVKALFPHASNPRTAMAIPALLELIKSREQPFPNLSPAWYSWSAAVSATELLGKIAPARRRPARSSRR